MRLIYLSPEMSHYGAAFYQQDVIEEMVRQHEVFFYGPGFPLYDPDDTIMDVIAKSPFQAPELICVGHGWLHDAPGRPVDRHPRISFVGLDIPKVVIMNKEYANLRGKLDYIAANRFDLAFTHHHDIGYYQKETGIRFIKWPFAMNPNYFKDYGLGKAHDLFFTGVLRNPTFPQAQTDVRIRVQKKLFYSIGEFRLLKRRRYREYDIFWRALPVSRVVAKISRVIHGRPRLPSQDYFRTLSASRICFSTLSPLGLVGPRYYEAMASKCLVMCPSSHLYAGLFEEGKHCVSFNDDLSDFDEKLFYYLERDEAREAVVESAYRHVLRNHTWEKRIQQFTDTISAPLQ